MPFKSDAQRKFLYAKHPEIAKRWEDKYGIPKNLPEHTKPKKPVTRTGKAMPMDESAVWDKKLSQIMKKHMGRTKK